MTNIFSLFSQKKAQHKTQTTGAKILAWFLAFSIAMQGVAVPLVAAAEIDLGNLASTTQAIIDNANNNNSNNNANLNALLGGLNMSNTAPVITLSGSPLVVLTQGGTYAEAGATVADLEDGDITSKLVILGTVDVNTVGSYTISYNATDSKNLSALEKQRNVTVIAPTMNNNNNNNNGNGTTITFTGGSTTGNGTSNSNANASTTCNGSSSSTNTDVSSSGNGTATGNAGTYTSNSGCGNASTTPPTTPQPPATTTPVIKDIPCTDTHNVQEGWYAQYYNYSKNDPEMEANAVSGPHIDPLNPSWTSHWYDTQYFRTGKIENNLQFGENFFPLDTQAEEWNMGGYGSTTWHEFHFGARWSAIATVSTTTNVAVTLTSDDDAWVYVDGVLALNNGGLHAPQTVTGTLHLTGSNRIDIFYAERHTVRAHMSFAFNTMGVRVTPFKEGCELPPPPPTPTPICALDVVSDATNRIVMGDNSIFATTTFSGNPSWTASIPGATWIWNSYFVTQPITGETATITKDFFLPATSTGAKLDIAADNSYSFSINGIMIGGDVSGNNYGLSTQDVYNIPASAFHTGTNTIAFVVKNLPYEVGTIQSNPAGLLYKLHVNLSGANCVPPPPPNTNQPPVITLVGSSTISVIVNTVFTDPGATASDPEDGARPVVATGTVNTSATGTYTITYNATDTQGLAATTKTRTVNVVPKNPECSDGLDNDNDGKIDYPADLGCDSPNDNDENNRPVITLVGSSTIEILVNTVFTDPGATANDPEDGARPVVATGTVNTSATGTYTITYNATDSKNLAAVPVVRTVKVNPTVTECNDGKDNDGDNKIDYPADSGCDSSIDNDENSAPVITVTSPNPMSVILGSVFTDPFATAFDAEDGTTTQKIVATGTVNTSVLGAYTITYNATDSKNLAATTKTRTVNVVNAPNEGCQTNCGGGGGGGCTTNCGGDCTANCTPPPPPPTGCSGNCGGGGSVLPITLTITNEKLTVTGTTTVTITWDTNQPSDSRVVYGIDPVQTLGTSTTYGYSLTTATVPALVTSHSLSISGVPSAIATYYRPVSSDGVRTAVGIELNRTPVVVAGVCTYLRDYMRLGIPNDPSEVTKLQSFLRNEEGFTDLAITGTFDITTDRAVRVFQDRYKADVLDSWNLPANTGYVYYTTKKKINELHCKSLFPLTGEQQAEIDAFRNLINGFTQNGTPVAVTDGNAEGTVLGAATSRDTKNRLTETKSDNDVLGFDEASSSLDASSTSATSTHVALTTRAKHLLAAAVGGLAGFAHISRGAAVVLIALMCAFIVVSIVLYRRRVEEDDLANFIQDAEEIED